MTQRQQPIIISGIEHFRNYDAACIHIHQYIIRHILSWNMYFYKYQVYSWHKMGLLCGIPFVPFKYITMHCRNWLNQYFSAPWNRLALISSRSVSILSTHKFQNKKVLTCQLVHQIKSAALSYYKLLSHLYFRLSNVNYIDSVATQLLATCLGLRYYASFYKYKIMIWERRFSHWLKIWNISSKRV